jgi:hypothetical protein
MSKQFLGRRPSAIFATVALVVATVVSLPGAANAAAPQCATASGVTSCQGATSDGAPYVMSAPLNFNGTVYLYSHGYRFAVDIPAGIPAIGGYKVTQTPQPAPNADVAKGLLSQGYGIAGSGPSSQRQSMLSPGESLSADSSLNCLLRRIHRCLVRPPLCAQ